MKVEKVNLTKDNLLIIKNIDETFYKSNLDINWYLERYTNKHIGYLLYDNDKVIGYIVSVPIKKELYDTITNGVLLNDININPSMFVEKSYYHYIVSIVILEEYRHKGYAHLLFKEMLKHQKDGLYCALTITKEGDILASKYMHLIKEINKDVKIYELKVGD